MNKKIRSSLFAVALLGAGIVAIAQTSRPATQPATQPSAAVPVNKFCPVMRSDPIDAALTLIHQGQTIGFCCAECIDEFKTDPPKYLKDMK